VAFQTAYLKAHHFEEFMAANLTLDLSNTDKVAQHIAECRAKGVAVLSPDINESAFEFVVTREGIRFGLGAIKNVGKGAVEAVLEERSKAGPFRDLASFLNRIALSKVNRRVVESLVKAGAFDSLHTNRRAMFEHLDKLLDQAQRAARSRLDAQGSLFSLEEFADDDIAKPACCPTCPTAQPNDS
jgi:DNA polymerase-3 subunit alpha